MAGRIENLKPWPKGTSGNPGGRPKRDIAAEIAEAIFERNPNAIYKAMLRELKRGNPRVFAILADRAYGKVKQQVAVENDSEQTIAMLEAAFRREPAKLSDAELEAQIDRLEAHLGIKQLPARHE